MTVHKATVRSSSPEMSELCEGFVAQLRQTVSTSQFSGGSLEVSHKFFTASLQQCSVWCTADTIRDQDKKHFVWEGQ